MTCTISPWSMLRVWSMVMTFMALAIVGDIPPPCPRVC
jgi:hypothetical protein